MRTERGAALLAAMLVATLVATLVSGLLWREHVRIRQLENQRLRDQAMWLGTGAVDWARLILREDFFQTRAVDHLGEVWAVPIAETPLSEFLQSQGMGGSAPAGSEETWLAGAIVDAQSRFNLTSLVDVSNPLGDRGWVNAVRINMEAVAIFARLLQSVGLDASGAPIVAQLMLQSHLPQTAVGDTPLPITQAEDLLGVLPGATPDALAQLGALTVVLPRPTPVNANTAPAAVLAAVFAIDPSLAQQLVSDRAQAFFADYGTLVTRVHQRAPQALPANTRSLGVNSEYFWVLERLRHGRIAVTQQALVARRVGPGNLTQVLWLKPGLPDGVDLGG